MCFLLHSILLWFICLAFYFDCFICWHRCCWSGELYRERMEKKRWKKCGKTLSVALLFCCCWDFAGVWVRAQSFSQYICTLKIRENKVRYEPNLKNKWTNDRDVQNECAHNTRRVKKSGDTMTYAQREIILPTHIVDIPQSTPFSNTNCDILLPRVR